MSEVVVSFWVLGMFVILLNGCAAGFAAILPPRALGRGWKVLIGAAATGFLLAIMSVPAASLDPAFGEIRDPLTISLVFAGVFLAGTVLSSPGALIGARKTEQPGDEYRTFD